jgi:hypothetical protein
MITMRCGFRETADAESFAPASSLDAYEACDHLMVTPAQLAQPWDYDTARTQ